MMETNEFDFLQLCCLVLLLSFGRLFLRIQPERERDHIFNTYSFVYFSFSFLEGGDWIIFVSNRIYLFDCSLLYSFFLFFYMYISIIIFVLIDFFLINFI